MNALSIFSNSWLLKLASIFGKTKIQTKILGANVTTDATDAITFNNLEVGKWYKFNVQAKIGVASSGSTARCTVRHDALPVGVVGFQTSATESGADNEHWFTAEGKFQATNTTLTLRTVGFDSTDSLKGDGTREQTYMQLEELPNHEITTQWT